MEHGVKGFIKEHPDFEVVTEGDKVRIKCSITGHEMPPKLSLLEAHIKDRYCILTKQTLNKIPKEVEAHVNGRKFRKLRDGYLERKARRERREVMRKAKEFERRSDDSFDSSSEGEGSGSESGEFEGIDLSTEEEEKGQPTKQPRVVKGKPKTSEPDSESSEVDWEQFEGIASGDSDDDFGNDSGDEIKSKRVEISLGNVAQDEDDGEFEVVAKKSSEESESEEEPTPKPPRKADPKTNQTVHAKQQSAKSNQAKGNGIGPVRNGKKPPKIRDNSMVGPKPNATDNTRKRQRETTEGQLSRRQQKRRKRNK